MWASQGAKNKGDCLRCQTGWAYACSAISLRMQERSLGPTHPHPSEGPAGSDETVIRKCLPPEGASRSLGSRVTITALKACTTRKPRAERYALAAESTDEMLWHWKILNHIALCLIAAHSLDRMETSRIDPREVVSAEQISAQLAVLARRESELTLALNALIADRNQIDNALLHLRELGSEVDQLSLEVDGQSAFAAPPFGSSSRGLGLQNGDGPMAGPPGAAVGLDGLVDPGLDDGLVERVRRVWETSERVGGKVRRLDNEISRVREAADIVSEVFELKVGLHWRDS